MDNKSQSEQLNEVVDRLLGREPGNEQGGPFAERSPPFDISRPSRHGTKKAFRQEKSTVEAVLGHARQMRDQLMPPSEEADPDRQQMLDRLIEGTGEVARQHVRRIRVKSTTDMARRNVFEAGFCFTSLMVIVDMIAFYEQHLAELKDQEAQFWSMSHRAPNYYARTIALRLARLYAKNMHKKPTFGIARDGNHPSTDFGRALEDVFSILGIGATVRPAAEWAIGQLTEDDLEKPFDQIAGWTGALRAMMERPETSADLKRSIAKSLAERP